MGRVGDWLRRRVGDPLVAELRQGATPEGLATSVAVGGAIGILPFLGLTTAAGALAGRLLRLNHVAIQAANYLLFPVQLALIVPLVRLGEALTGATETPLNPAVIVERFWESPATFLADYGLAGLHGLLGWTLVAIPAGWVVRRTLLPVFRRLSPKP